MNKYGEIKSTVIRGVKVNLNHKLLEQTVNKTNLFVSQMEKIAKSLPIDDTQKKELIRDIKFYGIDFIRYSQFQKDNIENENPWAAALLPLAAQVIDSINQTV